MRSLKNIVPLILLFAAAGCSKSAPELPGGGDAPYDPRKYITVTTQVSSAARGSLVASEADMTDFGFFCAYTKDTPWNSSLPLNKMFNQKMIKGAEASGNYYYWKYVGDPVEWGNENAAEQYTFFAYAPYGTSENGITVLDPATVVNSLGKAAGRPHISYKVPTANASQPDITVAVRRENIRPTGNPVSMKMNHALTAVGFRINGQGEKVTGIKMSGIYDTGILELDGNNVVWDLAYIDAGIRKPAVLATADFSALLNFDSGQSYYTAGTDGATRPILNSGGYLMMIPQNLGESAKVTLSFSGAPDEIIDLRDHVWLPGKRVIYNITLVEGGTITVEPQQITLPYYGVNSQTDNIEVLCEDAQGNPSSTMEWTLTSSKPAWLRLSTDPSATFNTCNADGTVSGTGSQTVYVFATENTSPSSTRIAEVLLEGGTVVDVIQLPRTPFDEITDTPLTGVNSYVGAFWTASQKGERVISFDVGSSSANTGAWSAYVAWLGPGWAAGDIVLALGGSSDTGIYTASPGNAESFTVEGSATAVSGNVGPNEKIEFRIGLNSTWTTTPRYAVVVL